MHLLKNTFNVNNVFQAGAAGKEFCSRWQRYKLPPLLLSLLFHLPLLLNDEWMWQVAAASEPVAPSEVDACRPPAL